MSILSSIKRTSKKKECIDPVCGMKVDADNTGYRSVHEDRTFYFCARSCLDAFEKEPGKYTEAAPRKPKGFWARYLERINRATGGKPPSCH